MTDIKIAEYTLPSHWASALFYGDTSGMEDAEIQDMNHALDRIEAIEGGHVHCADVKDDEEFGMPDFGHLRGNISTFVFMITPKEEGE